MIHPLSSTHRRLLTSTCLSLLTFSGCLASDNDSDIQAPSLDAGVEDPSDATLVDVSDDSSGHAAQDVHGDGSPLDATADVMRDDPDDTRLDAMDDAELHIDAETHQDAATGDTPEEDAGPAPECVNGSVERRTREGQCGDYSQERRCAGGAWGVWTGADPSVTCEGRACPGDTRREICDSQGNDVEYRCDDEGEWVVRSRVFGCTVASQPGAGTRACPGATVTRACWPTLNGRARATFRCEGGDTQQAATFTKIDEDFCLAQSGPEAGLRFCPGEVILRDNCAMGGARDYFICPDNANTDTSFTREASVQCGEANAWEPIHRGAEMRRWVSGGQRFRALRVDVCDASLRIKATSYAERRQRTSAWGSSNPLTLAAINGGFFQPGNPSNPSGLAFGEGVQWPGSTNSTVRGFVAFGEGEMWYSEVAYDGPAEALTPWVEEAVSHDFVMIRAGQVQSTGATSLAARTGLGFPEDRSSLYILTLDKGSGSAGMSVNDFAAAFAEAFPDTWSAVRLDGGGSTTLWTRAHGLVNIPSDGSERVVANHLGVTLDGGLVGYNCPR